ncbi:MAG: hypothetical protein GWN01_13235, partial [Nitrosopumilaceae archaeon]|nr:hypothetical protein [Nitrosopumilaceae archaeon]NIX62429.1 hypothetical protein [Nitrosopumilaceae archaeon]
MLLCIISLMLMVFYSSAQEATEWECGFADSPYRETLLESLSPIINDTMKVGLLLVQFSDWQTNLNARGGVGWTYSNPDSFHVVDTTKYKYEDYWNIFFSSGTYVDPPPPNSGGLHPDWDSHETRVYGSFTDYWW